MAAGREDDRRAARGTFPSGNKNDDNINGVNNNFDGLGAVRREISVIDDHINVLKQKLGYLTAQEQSLSITIGWQAISNCKRELDEAHAQRMKLARLLPLEERQQFFN